MNFTQKSCNIAQERPPSVGEDFVVRPLDLPKARVSRQNISIEAVLAAFNTWAYKREQPDCLVRLKEAIQAKLATAEPIAFVLYWGKGPRVEAGDAELRCLEMLSGMRHRIAAAYAPGADFRLIFTDTHAALNGYLASDAERYFASMRQILPRFGFGDCRLSALVDKAEMNIESSPTPADDATLAQLEKTAAKWYRGPGVAADGARRYFAANMVERQAVERAFPKAIFVSFNGSESRALFPDNLPIFYMYSMKKGVSVKPWFVP